MVQKLIMYQGFFYFIEMLFLFILNMDFFCVLVLYNEVLKVILLVLSMFEGFIKVIGEVGMGKILLCCKLINYFFDKFVVCYLFNFYLLLDEFCLVFVKEFGIDVDIIGDIWGLYSVIEVKFLIFKKEG